MILEHKKGASNSLLKAFISRYVAEDFFVNIARVILYPSDFGSFISDRTNSVIEYMQQFLKSLASVSTKLQLPNHKIIKNQIGILNTLLTIRETSPILLTYDNVNQHLTPGQDLVVMKLIQKAVNNRIVEAEEFRKITDEIINTISSYYEMMSVSDSITMVGNLYDLLNEGNLVPMESLKSYKEIINVAYNDLSKLQSLNKAERSSDYFVISDDKSCEDLSKILVNYVSKGFSVFKTGFELFDKFIEGFESSSVHLIGAPSNHAKSLFTINLSYRMIKNNLADFNPNDCILFVTLEDDIYKLVRRFAAIYGNYRFDSLKRLFAKSYEMTRATQIMGMSTEASSKLYQNLNVMFKNILKTSIAKVTKGKVSIVLKHCSENTFSPGDLGRFIDRLNIEGYNVKLVFIDYLDVMTSTINRFGNSAKEYDILGQITQELRNLAHIHKVPIISPTQNRREAENVNTKLSNELTGDSYKKIRYSDFIYTCRLRPDLNILSEGVRNHVITPKPNSSGNIVDYISPEIIKIKDTLFQVLVPFEVKITKSKDSEKDSMRYLLFCKENLRMYNNVDEYILDAPLIAANSDRLEKDINILTELAITSISNGDEQFFTEPSADNVFNFPDIMFKQ